jgi:hypothetical protein
MLFAGNKYLLLKRITVYTIARTENFYTIALSAKVLPHSPDS